MTPPRPTRLRLPLSRILAGAAAAGLTIAVPGLWSSAAVVPQAITNVSIRQTSTTVGSGMTLDPVSYTHLDVYKRQGWGWTRPCPGTSPSCATTPAAEPSPLTRRR